METAVPVKRHLNFKFEATSVSALFRPIKSGARVRKVRDPFKRGFTNLPSLRPMLGFKTWSTLLLSVLY